MTRALLLAAMFAAPVAAQTSAPAAYADTQLADPAQEAQARGLMETLRCVVCQGQSIADSDADMAGEMRALVRQRVAAGETPRAVRDWLIARYGDYVSYDPPVSRATLPLWLAPLLLLLAERAGRVVTREEILQRWNTCETGTNLIHVHLHRLREKLGSAGRQLETVRGKGVRLGS